MTSVPTAPTVSESTVIAAPLAHVWHFIKLGSFPEFWSALSKAEEVKGASPETDVVKWEFKDGTKQEVKMEEHSSLNHSITYSIITSDPALTYTSVLSTIRCYAVTSGPQQNSTFVQWTGSFSSDADAGVIEDARYKRIEALADLSKAATAKPPTSAAK